MKDFVRMVLAFLLGMTIYGCGKVLVVGWTERIQVNLYISDKRP